MIKFMQFLLKVDIRDKKHLSPWWKERGATATIPKMMSRQHIGSGNSLRVRCKRKDGVSESNEMKGGAIPSPGSHGSATRQPRNMTKGTKRTRCTHGKHYIQHNKQHTGHPRGRLGIPSKRAFRDGSRSSRDVAEVEEVVVHGARSRRCSGRCRGTWTYRRGT